jgi:hypothetical protein
MNDNRPSLPKALWRSALASLFAAVAIVAIAQEGFPLDGTWRAQLEGNRTVVVVMKWDGDTITGLINPGPRSVGFTAATLEPSDWGVRIEADKADGGRISVAGTLVDIGSYNRRIVGTWTENGATVDVELRRE